VDVCTGRSAGRERGSPAVLFRYSPDRKGERPRAHLANVRHPCVSAPTNYGLIFKLFGL